MSPNASDAAMDAQVIREFGDPEVFESAELDRPEPESGEVLIDVEASNVNPVDYKIVREPCPSSPTSSRRCWGVTPPA